MKRIGWIRTHDLPHRKTACIRPFVEVLCSPLIKNFLLFHHILKNVNFVFWRTIDVRTHNSNNERRGQTARPCTPYKRASLKWENTLFGLKLRKYILPNMNNLNVFSSRKVVYYYNYCLFKINKNMKKLITYTVKNIL